MVNLKEIFKKEERLEGALCRSKCFYITEYLEGNRRIFIYWVLFWGKPRQRPRVPSAMSQLMFWHFSGTLSQVGSVLVLVSQQPPNPRTFKAFPFITLPFVPVQSEISNRSFSQCLSDLQTSCPHVWYPCIFLTLGSYFISSSLSSPNWGHTVVKITYLNGGGGNQFCSCALCWERIT